MLRALGAGSTVADAERVLVALSDVDWSDLGGVAELSHDLGVSRQTVCNWAAGRSGQGFPKPLVKLRATPVWSRTTVKTWFEKKAT